MNKKLQSIEYKFQGFNLNIQMFEDANKEINDFFLDLENQSTTEDECPYYGEVWAAAYGLSDYLQGKISKYDKILELGCGIALPSMVSTKLGAICTATDYHRHAQMLLNKNILMNKIKNLNFIKLNWEKDTIKVGDYNRIIGSDIIYDSNTIPHLINFLKMSSDQETEIIIADQGRYNFESFLRELKNENFKINIISTAIDFPPHRIYIAVCRKI